MVKELFLVTYSLPPSLRVFSDLTPLIPLSLKERGTILKRGAGAPLKHPHVANLLLGEPISVDNITQLPLGYMPHAFAVYPAFNRIRVYLQNRAFIG